MPTDNTNDNVLLFSQFMLVFISFYALDFWAFIALMVFLVMWTKTCNILLALFAASLAGSLTFLLSYY
jgi:hypothetical protein